jgi:lipopolysaccharide transport system permease protein
LPWQFVSLTLTKATPSFVFERSLLQKARFPREIIPLSIILSNTLNLFLSEIILVTVLLFIQPPSLSFLLLLLPTLIWIVLIVTGLAMLTSSLNVKYRDVNFFVQTFVLLWFYATPVLYPLRLIPPSLQTMMLFNPLAAPFALFHTAMLAEPLPPLNLILANGALSLLILGAGYFTFRRQSPYFVDWL